MLLSDKVIRSSKLGLAGIILAIPMSVLLVTSCGTNNDSESALKYEANPSIRSEYFGQAKCTGEPTVKVRENAYSPTPSANHPVCNFGTIVDVIGTDTSDGQLYGRIKGYGSVGGPNGYIDARYLEPVGGTPSDSHVWPTNAHTVTSCFGPRKKPCPTCSDYHHGMDIGVGTNTVVFSSNAGNVSSEWLGCTGNTMSIVKGGSKSRYAHLSSVAAAGKYVTQRTIVARSGNTGTCTTGPHLHFETYANGHTVDPQIYLGKQPHCTKIIYP